MLLTFCQWVEGEIDELEEAGPLSAKHKKIRKLLEQRAAQHNRGAQLFIKHNVTAIFDGRTRHVGSRVRSGTPRCTCKANTPK